MTTTREQLMPDYKYGTLHHKERKSAGIVSQDGRSVRLKPMPYREESWDVMSIVIAVALVICLAGIVACWMVW